MRFVVDENLSLRLARGMREFGEEVDHLLDHFPAGTSDEEWLPRVPPTGTRFMRIELG